ncbi:ABC transporter permease subunit [Aliihoeflea aestuarii]|uniref:ABC transporter permease n=1 Tax=Aliihoeflea aestuarii TaxID=453840 RepID=UPI002093437B|nr:ABC transporter permease [Aliihoeflea aestuarii]MCO6390819.1 ABC transporter permease subunit [Aliihoeflea aestuarii]
MSIAAEQPAVSTSREPSFLVLLFSRGSVIAGSFLIALMVLTAVLAHWIAPFDPNALNIANRLQPPGSAAHLLGTDEFGRDVLSRVIHGARTSLAIGIAIVAFAVGIGTLIGLVTGFYNRVDMVLSRIMDGLMSFPGLVLAIAMTGVMGASSTTVVLALGIVYMPRVARIIRSAVLVVRELSYVEACFALGATRFYVLFRHVLPNVMSPIIIQATFIFSYAVLGEAALSFLGVGVPPTQPSWGNMLAEARTFIVLAWWMALFPGLAIMITVLGLNLFGDGLRDALDPKLKGR